MADGICFDNDDQHQSEVNLYTASPNSQHFVTPRNLTVGLSPASSFYHHPTEEPKKATKQPRTQVIKEPTKPLTNN